MNIIVNRFFDKSFARIIILKNSKEKRVYPSGDDYCVIGADDGDKIEVKLKYYLPPMVTIASFVYREGVDTYYIGPTMMHKTWAWLTFGVFPYFCLFFLALKAAIGNEAYDWFCTGMVVLTALSLILFLQSPFIPYLRKRMFKLDVF